jgi:hypothetical protein
MSVAGLLEAGETSTVFGPPESASAPPGGFAAADADDGPACAAEALGVADGGAGLPAAGVFEAEDADASATGALGDAAGVAAAGWAELGAAELPAVDELDSVALDVAAPFVAAR